MSLVSDILPDPSDPDSMAIWGALGSVLAQGGKQTIGIKGIGAVPALAQLGAAGIQGGVAGANEAQQYRAANLANQQGQLQLNYNRQLYGQGVPGSNNQSGFGSLTPSAGGSSGVILSPQQALQRAGILLNSPNPTDRTSGTAMYKAATEAIKTGMGVDQNGNVVNLPGATQSTQNMSYADSLGKNQAGITEGPNGPVPSSSILGTPPAMGALAPPSLESIPSNPTIPAGTPTPVANAAVSTAQNVIPKVPLGVDGKPLVASDNKPIVPEVQNAIFHAPDPQGKPNYGYNINTKQGQHDESAMFDADMKAQDSMTSTANNNQQMLARLKQTMEAFTGSPSGTWLAQHTDLANEAVGMGLIKDPSDILDISNYQKVRSAMVSEVMNQIKSANAGTSQGRILASEFNAMVGKMGDPDLQPEAIHDINALSTAMGKFSNEQVSGYRAIGGMGNRLKNGVTMTANDYMQSFDQTHNLADYYDAAKKSIPPYQGMPQQQNNSPKIKNYKRVNGNIVEQ